MGKRIRRGLLLLVLLGGLGSAAFFGGKAYMAREKDRAAMAAIDAQKPQNLLEIRAADRAKLNASPVPIEAAMQTLATKGRLGLGPALMPKPSIDQAPLMGWTYKPHDVPDWALAPPPTADGGAD
jgi:hypothetical protein